MHTVVSKKVQESSPSHTWFALNTRTTSIVLLILVIASCSVLYRSQFVSQKSVLSSVASSTTEPQDPNGPASEFNHHLVGYALIGMGLLVIAAKSAGNFQWLRYIWPLLFIAAGIFLAGWSDAEIWPRGNLNWLWLIHHDAEARQHKIYALLLILMGVVEYLRARRKLSRFWANYAFPLLALCGVLLLFFHDHSGGSGASSPEANRYVVSWLATATTAQVALPTTDSEAPKHTMHDHTMLGGSVLHSHQGAHAGMQPPGMEMNNTGTHHHDMTPAMLKIEGQHMWFALVGFAVILFKFVDDRSKWRAPIAPFLWPGALVLLGVLLVFYTETA
jgi:hypothetical protein